MRFERRGPPDVVRRRRRAGIIRFPSRQPTLHRAAAPASASHPDERTRPSPVDDDRWQRFGLYTAQHAATCQDRPGSFTYEARDAAAYCAWGVDYVKARRDSGSWWMKDAPSLCDDVKASVGRSPLVSSASASRGGAGRARSPRHVAAAWVVKRKRGGPPRAPTAFSRSSQPQPPHARTIELVCHREDLAAS